MTHTNGFPAHPPEPRERAAPVRVLVVELRDGNVVDTTEPTEPEVVQWLKDRGYEVNLTRRIPDPVVARELEFGAVIPDQLGQPGNPARDPRLTYIETNPATSFSTLRAGEAYAKSEKLFRLQPGREASLRDEADLFVSGGMVALAHKLGLVRVPQPQPTSRRYVA